MLTDSPIKQIIKRNGSVVPHDRGRIATAILKALVAVGEHDPDLAAAMAEKVESALGHTYGAETVPSVEDVQDVVESVLMDNHLVNVARNYIIYRHERAMARAARTCAFEVTDYVPYKKIYDILRWNMAHGCDSVQGLNRIITDGLFPQLVKDADQRYADEVGQAASLILNKLESIRIIIVAGPSSSGKTTTMVKLGEHLGRAGVSLKAINVDHYFFDLDRHPRDEFGDYDYETPQALDLALINEHLEQLLAGRAIKTPHYDFKKGQRTLNVHEMTLGPDEILLIDSLHGLYEDMTCSVSPENKFRVYIETLGQFRGNDGTLMRWADNRLLRRMNRDKDHRNQQPMETLTHWHYVRSSELKHIIPFIKDTDYIVNSALPYELPILKHHLFRYIREAIHRFKDDAKRLDAHIRANRVHQMLKPIKPIRDASCVPDDSLLREFIGGSRYKY